MFHPRPLILLLLATAAGSACAHFQATPYAIYPGPARPPAEVARLNGPIATVDGVDVSRLGSAFQLLPGCHVVVVREKLGEGSAGGAWSATIPRTVYAFQMVAGRSYDVNVHLQSGGSASVGNANVGDVKLTALEREANGKSLGAIGPLRRSAEKTACQETPVPPMEQAPPSEE